MISGFVFAHVYGKSDISLGEYAGRRFARLYPLHLVTLLAAALCQLALIAMVGGYLFVPENDLYHFLLHLAFIPSLGFEAGPAFNAPIWSVAVEVPVYLLFWICLRSLPLNTFTALGLAALFFFLQDVITFSHVDYCAMLFFIGVAIFHASHWFTPGRLIAVAVAAWAGWGLGALLLPDITHIHTLMLVMCFGPPLAILAGCDRLWSGESAVLDRMAGAGDLSYGIYLVHVPLLMLVPLAMSALGLERGLLSGNLTAMLIYLVITYWLAKASLRWIETPSRDGLRKLLKPASRPGAAQSSPAPGPAPVPPVPPVPQASPAVVRRLPRKN